MNEVNLNDWINKMKENIGAPIKEVCHADLSCIVETNDKWASDCPVCKEGMLSMKRVEGILQPEDHCLLCGQRFVYIDIEQARAVNQGEAPAGEGRYSGFRRT